MKVLIFEVRTKVLKATGVKMVVFWGVETYILVDINLCVRGVHCLHHQSNNLLTTHDVRQNLGTCSIKPPARGGTVTAC